MCHGIHIQQDRDGGTGLKSILRKKFLSKYSFFVEQRYLLFHIASPLSTQEQVTLATILIGANLDV